MRNSFLAWIVFFTLLGAALDDFPDPPALEPHGPAIASICAAYAPQFSPAPTVVMFAGNRAASLAVSWFAGKFVVQAALPVPAVLLVTQSSDASPPFASA